jgi:Fe(3+) dicitrate transport protein
MTLRASILIFSLATWPCLTSAQETPTPAVETVAEVQPLPPVIFDRMTVTGGPDRIKEVPGSAFYVSAEELRQQGQTDINRVLRQIPGVNIQEEDGYGLRPNIGMRGTGVERSEKITIMEDGVLIAPAPYAAPAAYYFPTIGRMEAVEVRKGSTSIRQGPYTTGGALNLISTSIPAQFGGRLNLSTGSDSTHRGHLVLGNSGERFGWLLETFQHTSDGFKHLDGGGSTGFTLNDYVGKLRWNSATGSRFHQNVELKLGHTAQNGDETYLGLTRDDFAADPLRRYAASAGDVIDTRHEQIQLTHLIALSAGADVTTTIYRNDFRRNWFKLDSVGGVAIARVLDDPATHSALLAVLRGEADDAGSLRLRNNRREYYGHGLQSVVGTRFSTGGFSHEMELGLRYHEDGEDRFQEDDQYAMLNGVLTFVKSGTPGSNANRITSASATAFFVQDRIRFGRWSVTPGFRVESIDFEVRDFGRADPLREGLQTSVRSNSVTAFVPGLGLAYAPTDALSLFTGVHKGFAPPGAGATARTRPEESVNFEAGFRWIRQPLSLEMVGFFSAYDNLLGRDTLATGGTGSGDLYNGGAVDVRGVELAIGRPFSIRQFRIPLRLAFTHTAATFQNSFETSFADWAPRVTAGDAVPYIPEQQWTLNSGIETDQWRAHAQIARAGAMRTEPGRGAIADGTGTDSHTSLDLTLGYSLFRGFEMFVQGRNLTDETYVAARRPAGLRPGMPRTMLAGINWNF